MQLEEDDEEKAKEEDEDDEDSTQALLMTRVPCEVLAYGEERVALKALGRSITAGGQVSPLKSKLEDVMQSTDNLLELVDKAIDYVEQVGCVCGCFKRQHV